MASPPFCSFSANAAERLAAFLVPREIGLLGAALTDVHAGQENYEKRMQRAELIGLIRPLGRGRPHDPLPKSIAARVVGFMMGCGYPLSGYRDSPIGCVLSIVLEEFGESKADVKPLLTSAVYETCMYGDPVVNTKDLLRRQPPGPGRIEAAYRLLRDAVRLDDAAAQWWSREGYRYLIVRTGDGVELSRAQRREWWRREGHRRHPLHAERQAIRRLLDESAAAQSYPLTPPVDRAGGI